MADDDQYLDDEREVAEDIDTGKKGGFLPEFFLQILKWVLIIVALIILIITVSVITYNIFTAGRIPESPISKSPEYIDPYTRYDFYNNIETIRGLTADEPAKTFIAELVIGYRKGRAKVLNELIDRTEQIENIILLFLGQKKSNELKTEYAPELQDQIKNQINEIMVEKIDQVLFKELQAF